MDTHQFISEGLTNLVFFQVARKCENSWRDLNMDYRPISIQFRTLYYSYAVTHVASQRISSQFRTLQYSYAVTHVASQRIYFQYREL